jgi:hypothetical protein
MFPAAWARRHARERLGIEPDEMNGGHYISLSRRASWPTGSWRTPPGLGERHGASWRVVATRPGALDSCRTGRGFRQYGLRERQGQRPRSSQRTFSPVPGQQTVHARST